MGPMFLSGVSEEVLRRLITSIITCGVWFGIALVLMRVLKIKNPNIRYLFYLLPLVKSLVAMMQAYPAIKPFPGVLTVNFQAPSPWELLPALPDVYASAMPAFREPPSMLLMINTAILVVLAGLFFAWRAVGLFKFERIIRHAPELDRARNRRVYEILERLVRKTGTPVPKLVVISSREAPFTVGLRRPIIAVSASILGQLSEDDIEAVLAHEIAHIARRDHIAHWPVVLLRDLQFFNPFTHAIFARLSFERERACDDFGSRLSRPLNLAKSLIKIEEIRGFEPSMRVTRTFAPQSLIGRRQSCLALRVKELLEPSSYRLLTFSRRFLVAITAFLFFYVELHIVAVVFGVPLILS